MLEHTHLTIRPAGPDGSRRIVAADDDQVVGTATWRRGDGPWWWPQSPVLAIHEHDDEPLLFTVRRRWNWPPRREVRDAEGQRVGELIGAWIRDEFGRRVATRVERDGATTLIGAANQTLATFQHDAAGLHFHFALEGDSDPFVKMLLLAAALMSEA